MEELNQLQNTLDKLYFISEKMSSAGDKVAQEVSLPFYQYIRIY